MREKHRPAASCRLPAGMSRSPGLCPGRGGGGGESGARPPTRSGARGPGAQRGLCRPRPGASALPPLLGLLQSALQVPPPRPSCPLRRIQGPRSGGAGGEEGGGCSSPSASAPPASSLKQTRSQGGRQAGPGKDAWAPGSLGRKQVRTCAAGRGDRQQEGACPSVCWGQAQPTALGGRSQGGGRTGRSAQFQGCG